MMKLMIQNGAAILHQFVSCKRPGKMSSYQAEQHLVVSKKGPAYKTTLTALKRPQNQYVTLKIAYPRAYLLAAGDADGNKLKYYFLVADGTKGNCIHGCYTTVDK
ncbi:hypothetical protein R3I93_006679 [Phoxinus phoxinus]|uniref:Uncharacterized protein n=1 Tax=Phoxinus phoxinus TaxID=58324 RepID=A0AAN9H916_9TELE